MATRRDVKQLVQRWQRQGYEVHPTSSGHLQFLLDGRTVAVASGTPSDWRGLRNTEAVLRRALREREGIEMPKKAVEAPRGSAKLIAERKAMKERNHQAIRQVLVSAKEPLTVHEIAARVGISTGTVADAAVELGLYRRKAQHSERGESLMGSNPFLYWIDQEVPARRNPIEGKPSTPKRRTAAVVPAPIKQQFDMSAPAPEAYPEPPRAQQPDDVMETVHALPDGRMLLSDTKGRLWVATPLEV